ncbi:MAG TPA: hypothetical protein G4O08_13600 [Anaerolineae bacterium]|nr:hypothetical protein [Anaerolineae bacterium]
MARQIWRVVLVLFLLFVSAGCGGDVSATIPEKTQTPSPMPSPEATLSPPERSVIHIPQGSPPVIDGTLSLGEWDDAAVEFFSDGSELLLLQAEGYLYLGIRADTAEMIAGNVFIHRGDEISILHASAALGTAVYQQETNSWQQVQGFLWRCRGTDNGEAAQAEREAFLELEHWIAANSRMGAPNELEYQIEAMGETLRLAVIFLLASDPNLKIPWPIHLDDDCIKPTPGGMPLQLHFSPDGWGLIGFADPGS